MAIANEASKTTGLRTSASSRLTVQELLNQAPLGNRRRVIILLGFLTMTLEGVEIGLWGFIYPQIVTQWGTSLATVTTMVTLGVVGLTVGSMVAGPLSDQIGRRLPIIVGTAGFGLATLGGALAQNDLTLGIFRVVACLFLGAVMPLVITLVAEFAPEKRKAAIVAITFTGFPLGTVITGFLASTIIPTLGWQWLLGTGTLLALILLPALLWGLPESTVFMIRRGGRTENVTKVLSAIIPGFDMKTVDLTGAVPSGGAKPVGGVRAVLSKKLVVVSLLIWLCYFICAAVVYMFLNYLPLIVKQLNIDAAGTGNVVSMFGLGGVIGALAIGFAMEKLGKYVSLGAAFTLAAGAAWILASVNLTLPLLLVLGFTIGVVLVGANSGMNALSTSVFPTEARATGVSWMHSFGKAGSIVSGLLGGVMLGAGWGVDQIFFALAIPLLAGAAAVGAVRAMTTRRSRADS